MHDIRQIFHEQLKILWNVHPILSRGYSTGQAIQEPSMMWGKIIPQDGYNWKTIVTGGSGLICELDILMLRNGPLTKAQTDIDNRLKTLFDALRIANPHALEKKAAEPEQDPFYVLLEDDSLITRVAVTTDTLLEYVCGVTRDEDAVRLVISVTVRPYKTSIGNVEFAS